MSDSPHESPPSVPAPNDVKLLPPSQEPAPVDASDVPVPVNALSRRYLLWSALLLEGGIVVIALAIHFFTDSLSTLRWDLNVDVWIWGFAGTIPLLILFWLGQRYPYGPMQNLEKVKHEILLPMLRLSGYPDVLLYSFLAGFCEELLFRGVLQASWHVPLTPLGAILLSNLLFGLVHPISWMYIVAVFIIGVYLGLLFFWTQSIIAVMIVHGLYDLVVMLYLKREAHSLPVSSTVEGAEHATPESAMEISPSNHVNVSEPSPIERKD